MHIDPELYNFGLICDICIKFLFLMFCFGTKQQGDCYTVDPNQMVGHISHQTDKKLTLIITLAYAYIYHII